MLVVKYESEWQTEWQTELAKFLIWKKRIEKPDVCKNRILVSWIYVAGQIELPW